MAKFSPGNCANPDGRPRGSANPAAKVRRIVQPHVAQLIEQRLADALQGDREAADSVLSFYAAMQINKPFPAG